MLQSSRITAITSEFTKIVSAKCLGHVNISLYGMIMALCDAFFLYLKCNTSYLHVRNNIILNNISKCCV